MSDFRKRLEQFLESRNDAINIERLTPDASTREYFRVRADGGTAIACVYPEPFAAAEQSYLDVTSLFLKSGLPVAQILDFDERLGVILLEDLGDRILRDVINESNGGEREALIDRAIALIPRIQAVTPLAYSENSVASRLKFDVEKLNWELDFFKTHYFTTLKNSPLSPNEDAALVSEFLEISRELENRAAVVCHRDFHAANLMVDSGNRLRIIDHQDARIGPAAYDLVSLLLDRVTEPPAAEWLAEKRRHFLKEREKLGLKLIDEAEFAREFRVQTVQRCLKAIGTFSFQSANRGKSHFVQFIEPMFEIVLRAAVNVGRFPVLQSIVERQLTAAR